MSARIKLIAAILVLSTLGAPAWAGGRDLHPLREPPKDNAKLRAQEAQKQKMLARLRSDAPRSAERAPAVGTANLPLFTRHAAP